MEDLLKVKDRELRELQNEICQEVGGQVFLAVHMAFKKRGINLIDDFTAEYNALWKASGEAERIVANACVKSLAIIKGKSI